jgi:peroxiredoxin-like protein
VHDLPHRYKAAAVAKAGTNVGVSSPGLVTLEAAGPAEFGGPGDLWSPETLLVGAVANCFILSFRAISRAARLEWHAISCDVEGVLDRVDRKLQFVAFTQRVLLEVPAAVDPEKARRLLEKAESSCLISNSLTASRELQAEIRVISG